MLSDRRLLELLQERLPAADLSALLRRVLRIPSVWRALHQGDLLEHLTATEELAKLTPAVVALRKLGLSPSRLSEGRLEALRPEIDRFWENVEPPPGGDDLRASALLALGLVQRARRPSGVAEVARKVLERPRLWETPLAIAFPLTPARVELLTPLFRDEPTPARLAVGVNALLANLSPRDSARVLVDGCRGVGFSLFQALGDLGERELASALLEERERWTPMGNEGGGFTSLDHDLALALAERLSGDHDGAQAALGRAWEDAARLSAAIADALADAAEDSGDPVTALEARRSSAESFPTPIRRASLAAAHLDLGQPDEALALLPESPVTSVECLAASLARIDAGDAQTVDEALTSPAPSTETFAELPYRWLERLQRALISSGQFRGALEVASLQVARRPADATAHAALSETALTAGGAGLAADHALLAHDLSPEDRASRRWAAVTLQEVGDPSAALPHWKAFASANPEARYPLVECALEAGDTGLARTTLEALLEETAYEPGWRWLHARLQSAQGDLAAAVKELRELVDSVPEEARAWVTLAEMLLAMGESAEAGMALQRGAQMCPRDGEIQAALSGWMRRQGRLTEALDAARKAAEFQPGRIGHRVELADLLAELGHTEEALDSLNQAWERFPASRQIREALAGYFEAAGEIARAYELVMPAGEASLDAESLAQAGRIAIRFSQAEGDAGALERGLEWLEMCTGPEAQNAETGLWFGRALMMARRMGEALEALERALTVTPLDRPELKEQISLTLAEAALQEGRPDMAISVLEQEREGMSPSAVSLMLSRAYESAGLTGRALEEARRACEGGRPTLEAMRQLFRCARTANQLELARQTAGRLTDAAPDDGSVWLQLAEVEFDAGRPDLARLALARALWIGRRDAGALEQVAGLLNTHSQARSAMRILQLSSGRVSPSIGMLRQLGLAAEACGEIEASAAAWHRLVELKPEDPLVLDHAGKALWAQGKRAAAIGMWQQALASSPSDSSLLKVLGRAYAENGEAQLALEHFSRALENDVEDAELALEAGQIALQLDEPGQALLWLERAAQLDGSNASILAALGECFYRLDRPDEAMAALVSSLDNPPAPPRAGALLARLALDHGESGLVQSALDRFEITEAVQPAAMSLWMEALLHAGRWEAAVRLVALGRELRPEAPDVSSARILLSIRLAIGSWLFGEAAGAERHAPSPNWVEWEVPRQLLEQLGSGDGHGLEPETAEALQSWLSDAAPPLPLQEVRIPAGASAETAGVLRAAIEWRAAWELKHGRPEQSIRILDALATEHSPAEWSSLVAGLAYARTEQAQDALRSYLDVLKDPSLRPLALALSADAWVAQGNLERAVACLNSAVVIWPDEHAWHDKLAALYIDLDRPDEALPHFQAAVELEPTHAGYLLHLARALKELGHLSQAADAYRMLIAQEPSEAAIWREAGEASLSVGEGHEALGRFERATALEPSHPAGWLGRAHAALQVGEERLSASYAQRVWSLASGDPVTLAQLAGLLARLGQTGAALEVLDQLEAKGTLNPPARLARARLLLEVGRQEEAGAELSRLTGEDPSNAGLWLAFSEAREAMGELDLALQHAQEAARLSPDDGGPHLLIGRLCRRLGHLDRALEELARAAEAAPQNAAVPLELGRVYEERREIDEALGAYERAMELDRSGAEAPFRAAMIMKNLKAYPEAGRLLKRAVDLDPKNREALHQLAAVRALELVHGGMANTAVSS